VALAGPWNTVEKVVVGPVGSPREPENKAKTLPKRRIQPLNRGRRERKGVFQQAVAFLLTEAEIGFRLRI
jgi:hypothetical protein